jgi:predicted cupin superfamily sugar epimerase
MRDAKEIVDALGMQPHQEGGWYVEIHRSLQRVEPVPGAPTSRAAMTSIYYLLESGQRSHWHRVDADELWAWHAGAPMELSIAAARDPDAGQAPGARAPIGDERTVSVHRLGMSLASGERPQAVVPAHAWQSARPMGEWSLIGCVVAPGFEFAHFEIAPPGWSP